MTAQAGHATKDQFYEITTPTGKKITPPEGRCWSITKDTFLKLLNEGRIYFGVSGDSQPNVIRYLSEIEGFVPWTWWPSDEVGHTDEAKKEIREYLDISSVFDTPKPVRMLKRVIEISTEKDSDIILDFFSGSATTAHAVLDLNKEDGGRRHFILVQMSELTPPESEAAKAGYKTIAEIGKERIRRVIKKIREEKSGELAGAGDQDLGFKVYKLAKSNFKPWENYHGESVEKIEELFTEQVTPLVPGWKKIKNGLLTEILLLEGFPLNSTTTCLESYPDNAVVEVACEFREHRLIVCLDDTLAPATVKALTLRDGDTFVCLDSAVDSQTKTRLSDKGQIKTI